MRHTRAVAYDRTKRPATAPPAPQIEQRLEEIVHPATLVQVNYFWELGLRERTLTLPVMMALVLSMIWRQISSVGELVRTVQQQCLLWETPRKLTPQAVSQRLNSLPADLFWRVLEAILPELHQRWAARHRPVPARSSLGAKPLHASGDRGWFDSGCLGSSAGLAARCARASPGRPYDRAA